MLTPVKARPLLVYVLAVLLLAGVGLGAKELARISWLAYVNYATPFAAPLERGAPGPPLARRVILIVVDGLRVDAFDRMSLVERYRPQASHWRVWTGEPSLSYPGWTTILSGAPPEITGVTTNWFKGPVKVDHLLAAARAAGMSTALAGNPGWGTLSGEYGALFAGAIDDFVAVPDPPYGDRPAIHDTTVAVTRAGERFLGTAAPLVVLHYPAPDLMGHGYGALSEAYADSVRLIDEELTQLLGRVDLRSTTVVLTADHGHIDRGGHGGWEPVVRRVPLLFFGAGIVPGEGFEGRLADIAPTIATLLGLPLPAHSIGRPLIEALAEIPAGLEERWGKQQAILYDAYSMAVQGRHAVVFTTPLGGADPDALLAAADDLNRLMADWRGRALARDQRRRLPVAALLAALPLAYVLVQRPRRDLLPALAGTVAFFGTALGLFYGRGYYFSLSVINREDLLLTFFEGRTLDAAAAAVAGALVAGWFARRRGPAAGAVAGLSTAYFSAYALLLLVLAYLTRWGIRFPYYLPDLREGFRYYVGLLALTPVGLLAAPLVPVSLLGYGVGRLTDRLLRRSRPAAAGPATPGIPSSAAAPARQRSAAPASTEDSTQNPL